MRDDTCSGFELLQYLGAQPEVDRVQKIEREYRGLAEIGLEEILVEKCDKVFDIRGRTGAGGGNGRPSSR